MLGKALFLVLVNMAGVNVTEVYEVIGTHQLIKVLVGEDVVLPCHVEPPLDVTSLTIEWRLKSVLVHVYRNWQDDDTLQHVAFKGRTSLFHNKMKTGNISLKISSVNEADEGNYMCSIPKLDSESRRGYTSLIVSHGVGVDGGLYIVGVLSIIIIMAI